MKLLGVLVAAGVLASIEGCRGASKPDFFEMGREMSGEFRSFTAEVTGEVADRVSDGIDDLTGRDEKRARSATLIKQGWMVP